MLELLIAIPCSVIAFVYAGVLMDEDKILFGWWKFLNSNYAHANEWHNPILEKFFYMLMCPVCMSGQFALWTYLIMLIKSKVAPVFYPPTYQFIDNYFLSMIFTISLSILFTKLLVKWT